MLGLFLKMGEGLALWWSLDKPLLSLVTALPWMHFVIVAVIVEANDLNKTRIPQDHLPKMTNAEAGVERKIILEQMNHSVYDRILTERFWSTLPSPLK